MLFALALAAWLGFGKDQGLAFFLCCMFKSDASFYITDQKELRDT